ncbi:hypothetical protein [Sulfurimonas paralvinellae]|uniref:DUF721 domain-containing protein n=1 Tax=Sulfurimonas paralvinellae TaxID=317658 RepID=A0A7M1B9D7_9BACT|nr:hypothetical protein [Sulfurimonas paralvinellae]QOP46339.1 hypothetical protein FM071_08570 [Sulfurimonas paralvinellae]
MKNACDIIHSLQNRPQFSKLSRFTCIDKIRSSFSSPLQKMIKFSYIKNNTLFFVLNHPGAKQEFDNNIQSIKSALKFVQPQECKALNITDIKAFVTHTPTVRTAPAQIKEPQTYPERSSGEFKITTEDEKLRGVLESIQNIIKEKHES